MLDLVVESYASVLMAGSIQNFRSPKPSAPKDKKSWLDHLSCLLLSKTQTIIKYSLSFLLPCYFGMDNLCNLTRTNY